MKKPAAVRHDLPPLIKHYHDKSVLRVVESFRKPYSRFMVKMGLLSLWTRAVGGPAGIRLDLVSERWFPGEFMEQHGSIFATPGIAEKGYFDLTVEVTTPGGHSSVPPKHTVSLSVNAPENNPITQQSVRVLVFLQHFSSSMRHIQLKPISYVPQLHLDPSSSIEWITHRREKIRCTARLSASLNTARICPRNTGS